MDSQAKSGALSILTALAAAIAPALAKAVIERRSRSQSKKGSDEMCRNHSHVTGRIFSLQEEGDVTTVRMLVTQPLSLETSTGMRLTLPRYTVLSVRLAEHDVSLVPQLQEMVVQAAAPLSRDETNATSGLTTPPR